MSDLVDIRGCADWIEQLQRPDGAIPWVEAGIWDAWNHGESAMALAIAGRREATLKFSPRTEKILIISAAGAAASTVLQSIGLCKHLEALLEKQ